MAATVAVTTDDGSAGTRGVVTDVLPELMARAGTDVVYACGPMGMLRRGQPSSPPPRASRRSAPSRSRWPAASGSA